MKIKIICCLFILSLIVGNAYAASKEYNLLIRSQNINLTGHDVAAMTINGGIPGPVLRFTEGETARIHVRNEMAVETSIHWHGLLLPNLQDGVPYLTTPPIKPGGSFTYEFPLKQSGTYWYHSHTGLQEQRGVYGAFVVEPLTGSSTADLEHVVVLSDWTDEDPEEVLRTLKSGNDYYSLKKGTMQSLSGALKAGALKETLQRSLMRMPPMDIADVAYDAFLTNGGPEEELDALPGQTVHLRIINAAASTYFYLHYAGGALQITSADGLNVVPVDRNRFLIAVAETYDVFITVPAGGAYELRATAQDGSGHTSLFVGRGSRITAPDVPFPDLYKMHAGDHTNMADPMTDDKIMKHDNMMKHNMMEMPEEERPMPPYEHLKSMLPTTLPAESPLREVRLELTGDMERYIWSINGKTLNEADMIKIKRGENVRFVLINKTMMHHPMHLHGHFFRVLNRHGDYSPLKHTVDVPPLGETIIEFYADEEKDWFFHCHVLYHMKAGMARAIHYEGSELSPQLADIRKYFQKETWYASTEISILSQMTEGTIRIADTRNTLMLQWEADWD
ncbi:multicopper oxidase domain-containing protein, partial [bacterium]|nr:multicopper oxidase domain-containing protein [bacterium]